MVGFWGAAFQGQQDAMNNIIARKQAEQRLIIEQQQQERLRQQAQQQQYEFEQQQKLQPYREQLLQQQLQEGAFKLKGMEQAQGFASDIPQTVPPGTQSQPMQQGIPGGQQQPIAPPPWKALPQGGQQQPQQWVIPPRPQQVQPEQQFDASQTQDLGRMQQGLQVASQQLMNSPNEPENAFRRWAGNDPARNSPAGQEWFMKNKLPFHEKLYKAETDNFNRQIKIFEDAKKVQDEARLAKSSETRDKTALLQQKHLQQLIDKFANPQGSGSKSPQGAQARARIASSMTQAADAITNLSEIPITTGTMFSQKNFDSLMTAPLSALNQELSSESSQMLNTAMAGVARNLASLETGGAATGLVGLADKIDQGIAIPAGSKLNVSMYKLAEMRRIVESSARMALSSSEYSEDQKDLIRTNLEFVRKAIPMTQHDIVTAMKSKNKEISFNDYMKQNVPKSGKTSEETVVTFSPVKGFNPTNEQLKDIDKAMEYVSQGKATREEMIKFLRKNKIMVE